MELHNELLLHKAKLNQSQLEPITDLRSNELEEENMHLTEENLELREKLKELSERNRGLQGRIIELALVAPESRAAQSPHRKQR